MYSRPLGKARFEVAIVEAVRLELVVVDSGLVGAVDSGASRRWQA